MRDDQLTVHGNVDPRGLAVIKQLLADQIVESAWYADSTPSTNTVALDELGSGARSRLPLPRLFLTDQQTSGRGRRGRGWLSSDQTLTFSILLDLDHETPSDLLSLAVGVGIARSLEFDLAPLRTRIKWPNDVYAAGGKVAGILLETTGVANDRVVIGVGLNVGAPPEIESSSSSATVCSLHEATGRITGRYDHLYSLVQHLMNTVQEIDRVVPEFKSRCLLAGKTIRYLEGGVQREGRCLGIDDRGALIVESENETQILRSGEVHLIRHGRNE
jgi:BirA family biotin operon repressor/biotin-[acetyl-CoA-carboxylase] ligase